MVRKLGALSLKGGVPFDPSVAPRHSSRPCFHASFPFLLFGPNDYLKVTPLVRPLTPRVDPCVPAIQQCRQLPPSPCPETGWAGAQLQVMKTAERLLVQIPGLVLYSTAKPNRKQLEREKTNQQQSWHMKKQKQAGPLHAPPTPHHGPTDGSGGDSDSRTCFIDAQKTP